MWPHHGPTSFAHPPPPGSDWRGRTGSRTPISGEGHSRLQPHEARSASLSHAGGGGCSDPAPPSLPAPSLGLPRPGPASRGSCRARHLRPTCWLSHRAGRCHSRDLAPRPRRKSEGRSLGDKGDATAPAFGTREGSRPTTASAAVSLSRAHVINSHRFAKPCVRAVPRRLPVTRRCQGVARQPEAAAGHGVVHRGRRGPWPPTRQVARRSAEPPGAHGAEGKCGIARVD